jgi:hypothetical protein
VADLMRGAVAFVIDPNRIGFPNMFADITEGEQPIQLFRILHEARAWIGRARRVPPHLQAG